MDVHESPGDIEEDDLSDLGDEYLDSVLNLALVGTVLDDCVEQLAEVVEGELVHGVDVGQVGHYEVEDSSS